MVSIRELDSFVTKFKHLLHNGFEATLSMEANMGKAFVVLKAGLDPIATPFQLQKTWDGPQKTKCSHQTPSQINGGNRHRSPSYKRRQERRRILRENFANTAEEAENEVDGMSPADTRENLNHDLAVRQTEMFASKVEFDVSIAVQEEVKSYDILEALDENFIGGLSDRNVHLGKSSPVMYVHQIEEKAGEVNTEEEIKVLKFRIYVSNDENAIDVVQNWKNNGQFDDLAFRNSSSDKRQVRIQEIKKLR